MAKKSFNELYPELSKIPDEFQLIRKYHENKKSHLFNLGGNAEDFHRHLPWNIYAPKIFSVGKKFAFIIVIRNSGEVHFVPTTKWKETEYGLAFDPDQDNITINPAQLFYEHIITKIPNITPWIMNPFLNSPSAMFINTSTGIQLNRSWRIGNLMPVFLELIDNIITGNYSEWNTTHCSASEYGYPILLIIENASAVFNENMVHFNPKYDENYVFDLFNKWKNDSRTRSSLIIISDRNQTRLNQKLKENLTYIDVKYPNKKCINEWIRFVSSHLEVQHNNKITKLSNFINNNNINELVKNCQGLSLIDIEDMLVMMHPDKTGAINTKKAMERKKEIIRDRYGSNLIEILDDKVPLNNVVLPKTQKDGIKKLIINPIKKGRFDLAPRGVLLMGPAGTGKTILAKSIGTECHILTIKLNIRNVMSRYVGMSEERLSMVLSLFKALKPCIVIMDEIDQQMRGRNANNNESDGGTSSALRGMLLEFMSDPKNKGIIFFSMTNAPESLDYAQTRSGRNDIRIPILLPDENGRKKLLKLHLKIQNIPQNIIKKIEKTIENIMSDQKSEGYSGADIELIAKDFKREFELNILDNTNTDPNIILQNVIEDLNHSSRYSTQLTEQSLALASHKSLVPESKRMESEKQKLKHNDITRYNRFAKAMEGYNR